MFFVAGLVGSEPVAVSVDVYDDTFVEEPVQHGDRILELRSALDADVLSDYFLWAFKKQSKKDEGAPEVRVASLGSIDPNGGALVFNPAQTFPHLQVRYRSAAEGLTNALINGLLPHSIVDARRALREFLHDKNVDYLKKQLKAWQAVQKSD